MCVVTVDTFRSYKELAVGLSVLIDISLLPERKQQRPSPHGAAQPQTASRQAGLFLS
jgi:hypothetical protein